MVFFCSFPALYVVSTTHQDLQGKDYYHYIFCQAAFMLSILMLQQTLATLYPRGSPLNSSFPYLWASGNPLISDRFPLIPLFLLHWNFTSFISQMLPVSRGFVSFSLSFTTSLLNTTYPQVSLIPCFSLFLGNYLNTDPNKQMFSHFYSLFMHLLIAVF